MPALICFALVFSLLIGIKGAISINGCNPLYCLQTFDSLFINDQNTSCFKAKKLLECASKCTSGKFLSNGLESLKNSLCSELYIDDSTNVNKCIFKQRFAILSCMYSYSNLEAEDPLTDVGRLNCRKSLDVGSCSKLNAPCTARASHVSEIILHNLLNSFLDECHDFDTMDIAYIAVKPLSDYTLLANCMDENSQAFTQCLSKWLNFKNDSCRSMKFFVNCMQEFVHNKCSSQENSFVQLSQMLLSNIHFFSYCNNNSEFLLKQGNEVLDESAKHPPHDEEDVKITGTFSSILPSGKTDKNTPDKNEFKTFDPLHHIINNTQDLHLEQSSKENKASVLHSQILSTSEAKSSNEPTEHQPGEQEDHNKNDFKIENSENSESKSPSSSNSPPNSSTPIVIHKTTFITLTIRGKSNGSNVLSVIMLIGMCLLSLFLYSKF